MKPPVLKVFLAFVFMLSGCGADESSTSSVSAALWVPRGLADNLKTVTIYLIQTKNVEPDCPTLLGDVNAYQTADVVKSSDMAFDVNSTNNQAIIDGIPWRGAVWRFYARGYSDTAKTTLIAHGCDPLVWEVASDKRLITVSIDLCDSGATTCP